MEWNKKNAKQGKTPEKMDFISRRID